MVIKWKLILSLFVITTFFSFASTTVSAQTCLQGSYTCKPFNCYNTSTQKYEYDSFDCGVSLDPVTQQCEVGLLSSYRTFSSTRKVNTNWNDSDAFVNCGSPSGCNQGFQGGNIPSCSGQEGGGGGEGSCPSGCSSNSAACTADAGGPSCPSQWSGDDCADLPCAYRDDCGCGSCLDNCSPTCEGDGCIGGGSGGGGPTAAPTPTPTPAPSCTLTCPGTQVDEEVFERAMSGSVKGVSTELAQTSTGGTGGTGTGGTGDSSSENTTYSIAAGIAEGDVEFYGVNNFDCRIFNDGNGHQIPCPSPTIISGSGGTSDTGGTGTGGSGGTTKGASTIQPRKALPFMGTLSRLLNAQVLRDMFGKVLGTSTLLAQTSTGGTGGTTGTGGTSHNLITTWTYPVRYHILNAILPQSYTATATSSPLGGTSSGTPPTCSCSVALLCPATGQDPNDAGSILEGCDNQCDFSVSPAQEHVLTPLDITINTPPGFGNVTIDYDDGTSDSLTDVNETTQVNHAYTNSGVYDVSLTCTTNGGGAERSCTRRLTSYCTGTDIEALPTATPTPTPTPGPWFKVQDSSFHIRTYVTSYAPSDATPYDSSDIGRCSATNPNPFACFSSGESGAVSIQSSLGEFGAEVSTKGWLRKDGNYVLNSLMTPASFLEYVKARKDYKVITSLASDQIESNRIHLYDPEVIASVSDNSIPDLIPAGSGIVVLVDGDLVMDMASEPNQIFNPSHKAITFIVTGTLQISALTTELNAIFVANEVDFAYDFVGAAETPLKIDGNISVMNTPLELCNEHRMRTDTRTKPTCLFQLDFENQFIPVIDLLSTRTYDWTELVPSSTE